MRDAADAITERKKALGERIREARLEKRWKQKRLAAELHVEPITVSRWERGQHAPDLDMIELIAERTGKPISHFLPDAGATQDQVAEERAALLSQFSEVADGLMVAMRELRDELRGQAAEGRPPPSAPPAKRRRRAAAHPKTP